MKDTVKLELHGFSDASLKSAAGVMYLRAVMSTGEILVSFIASKTKITPLSGKPTIPKLELIAGVVLSKLCKSVYDSLKHF